MICKIIDSFDKLSLNLNEIQMYNILLYGECLYVSDINSTDNFYDVINNLFQDSQIIKINENNLIYEPINIIEWARQQFTKTDLINYEKDNQEKLRNAMYVLDCVEKELFERRENQWQMSSQQKKEEGLLKKIKNSISMNKKNK